MKTCQAPSFPQKHCGVASLLSIHFIRELSIALLSRSSSFWISCTKIGLTLALLGSQMPAQAAPNKPSPPNPNDASPVIVSTDRVKHPHKHRETKRARAEPEKLATKPQQMIKDLR